MNTSTLKVGISTYLLSPKPDEPSKLKIEFLNPQTNQIQEHNAKKDSKQPSKPKYEDIKKKLTEAKKKDMKKKIVKTAKSD